MVYEINKANEDEIKEFIQSNYHLFGTGYKEMCETNKYYHKLFTHSNRFEIWKNSQLIGLLCCYFNEENKYAYVPYVCIREQFMGKGLASKLFQHLTFFCLFKEFHIIKLEVRITNKKARNLYTKLDFKEISRNHEKIQMIRELA